MNNYERNFRFPFKRLSLLQNAFKAIEELKAENPAYGNIKINWVEDQDAHELFKTHPYEYYPNLWFDLDKQYEAKPGESYEETKQLIKAVFDKAL